MANMDYCRFRNTLRDLAECEQALDDGALDDSEMDEVERRAMEALVRRCARIARNFADEVPAIPAAGQKREA